ncbi:family A G protein-coupled receptor-like protein [Neoconidiobolus thromboides FSU 785]|nr:family A G protein-coupled receptor-like protein [Neoconidiobolus thromboides FSU 785]
MKANDESENLNRIVNIALAIIVILSLILNSLLIIILLKKRKQTRWNINDKLIILIAIIDISEGVFGTFSCIYHTLYGKLLLFDKPWYCQISGYIMTGLLMTSILLLLLVAVYRFKIITYRKNIFNPMYFYVFLIVTIVVHGFGLYCLFDFNFYPVGSGAYCYPSLKHRVSGKLYYTIIGLFNLIVPILFGAAYLGIFFNFHHFIRKQKRNSLELIQSNSNHSSDSNTAIKMEAQNSIFSNKNLVNKVSFRAIIYIFIYLPIWIPNLISVGWDLTNLDKNRRTEILVIIPVIGILLTILINPIMVFLVDSKMFDALLSLLKFKKINFY